LFCWEIIVFDKPLDLRKEICGRIIELEDFVAVLIGLGNALVRPKLFDVFSYLSIPGITSSR
jgi:MoaA/NifB/PqqE/SkfB family radical SAM enzyme